MDRMKLLCVMWLCVGSTMAYPWYQSEIPNGDKIKFEGNEWKGVGHNNANGGGSRNAFGMAFANNGMIWDETLCRADSDGDGITNGEELGDPECVWKKGDKPSKEPETHPGICEPTWTETCMRMNADVLIDSVDKFKCDATKAEDVEETIIRFPVTEVPAEETSYYCHYFPLNIPEGSKEHVIAFEPIIDNVNIMHHMIAYGCRANQTVQEGTEGAVDCDSGMSDCQELMLLWVVGTDGLCFPDEFGALIGEGGYTGIWLEHHWNNPDRRPGMTDSSGMKLYHTPKLRGESGAFLTWGSFSLTLPPMEEHILQQGTCHPACTETMGHQTIYISQIIPHMHVLGTAMSVSINGKQILEQTNYDYNSPEVFYYDPPLAFERGDRLDVNCTFTTTSTKNMTYWGEGTNDEMCFALTLAYPVDETVPPFCSGDAGGFGYCNNFQRYGDFGDCDVDSFWTTFDFANAYIRLSGVCDERGIECKPGCQDAISEIRSSHPCWRDDHLSQFIKGHLIFSDDQKLANWLYSCDPIRYDPRFVDYDCRGDTCAIGAAGGPAIVSLSLLLLSALILQF